MAFAQDIGHEAAHTLRMQVRKRRLFAHRAGKLRALAYTLARMVDMLVDRASGIVELTADNRAFVAGAAPTDRSCSSVMALHYHARQH